MALSQNEADDGARKLVRTMFADAVATVGHDVVLAAFQAGDGFLDANQAAMNSALPLAFRNATTLAQRADLYAWLCQKRAGRV